MNRKLATNARNENLPTAEELIVHDEWMGRLARALIHAETGTPDQRMKAPMFGRGPVLLHGGPEAGGFKTSRRGLFGKKSDINFDRLSPVELMGLKRKLINIVFRLNQPYKSIFFYHFYKSKQVSGIAEAMKTNADTVSKYLNRAIQFVNLEMTRQFGSSKGDVLNVFTHKLRPGL